MNRRLLLIDGLGCLFTHFHAKESCVEQSFIRNLGKILQRYPAGSVIFLQEGGSEYRKNILPSYKAARKERRESGTAADKAAFEKFMASANNVATILPLLGVKVLQKFGAEADDLAGFMCAISPSDHNQIMLLSEDSDWSQLLERPNTVQGSYRAMCKSIDNIDPRLWVSAGAFERTNGYTVQQAFEAKMLCGDTADSIPGIEGLGATGALNLIKRYGCIKELLRNREQIDVPRITTKAKEGLLACEPILDRNLKLMNLRWDSTEWREILKLDLEYIHEWLAYPTPDYKAFEEICYENGWLYFTEELFLATYRRQVNA